MDEFSLINTYFKSLTPERKDVVFGISDDAACLQIPLDMQLLVSCDTLVSGVHFLSSWDAYDIAYRAVMVNVSDIAAMGGTPCWVTLALTLPSVDESWLKRFAEGLRAALGRYHIALIGGDTTRGPLCITLTIHGFVPKGKALRRKGAQPGDKIYVSGELGAAALAVSFLANENPKAQDQAMAMQTLLHPEPRIDLGLRLRDLATAAIDVSDGLGADLNHICEESHVGACLIPENIPIHPLVKKYKGRDALDFALSAGDDYELCFTVPESAEGPLGVILNQLGLRSFPIGVIEEACGLRLKMADGTCVSLAPRGYNHF